MKASHSVQNLWKEAKILWKKVQKYWKSTRQFLDQYFPQHRVEKAWKKLRRMPLFWVGVGLISAWIVFAIVKSILTSPPEEVAVVGQNDFIVEIIEAGEVQASSERIITTPETWLEQIQIIKLVPEGTVVKKGDFLAQFDVGTMDDELTLAKQQLEVAKADYQKFLAQDSLTMHNLQNNVKLNEYSLEQAKLQLEMQQFESDAVKEQARLQLKQAEIRLSQYQQQLASQKIIQANRKTQMLMKIRQNKSRIAERTEHINRLTILAPADGMVVYKDVGSWQSRERLKEGYKARHGEGLMSVPDMSRMRIKFFANEMDRSLILPGQHAKIVLDAYPKVAFNGTVVSISRLAQNVRWNSKLKGFEVIVDVKEADKRLKPGMSAMVRIGLDSLKNVMIIPVGVVFEVDGKPAVYRKGRTKPTFITLGPRDDGHAVVEKGLKPGWKLSWHPLDPKLSVYGLAEEKRRIQLAAANLEQSFFFSQQKGTLYDYSNPNRSRRRGSAGSQNGQDMENVLRQYLRRQGGSGQQGGNVQITPEMMQQFQSMNQRRQGGGATNAAGEGQQAPQGQQGSAGRSRQMESGQGQGASTGEGGPQSEMTPEMREQFRQMRQQRQQQGGAEEAGGSDASQSQGGQSRRRQMESGQGQGTSEGQGGQQSEMTPEMRERFRQMRQQMQQGGGAEGQGGPPFEMTPEMRERFRQMRQRQPGDTSAAGARFRPDRRAREGAEPVPSDSARAPR